jgi:MFS family permease
MKPSGPGGRAAPDRGPPRLQLPPIPRSWCLASSAAAAISYADRGASAIVASQLLESGWTESQLGGVQGSFFAGYALTQVLGGLLGGGRGQGKGRRKSKSKENMDGEVVAAATGNYRSILPISLSLTAIATLLFPIATECGGSTYASIDRFFLGLAEGLLLPAAMAGVSDTTSTTGDDDDMNNRATASSVVIAGCYLGSAWSYLSAWVLFSERFQTTMLGWMRGGDWWALLTSSAAFDGNQNILVWPWVFYLNGFISLACIYLFREEFVLSFPLVKFREAGGDIHDDDNNNSEYRNESLWKDALSIVNATLSSKSGRAIIVAQIGQGALLYSIASWGPLYLERVNAGHIVETVKSAMDSSAVALLSPTSSISMAFSPSAVSASIAASSLILPQVGQALVGVAIGFAADRLSSNFGTRLTRRTLQLASGVIPAVLLWYLSQGGREAEDANVLSSPAFLFGMAQTFSALSLGAVSVSHLDVASPSSAGAVYALGNVASAASGSIVVNLVGRFLEQDEYGGAGDTAVSGAGDEFALPFRTIAILSAVCSLVYGCNVETGLEISFNETATS